MIDRIVLNAKIYTQNPTQPWATALAIIGERIVAVGDDDAIRVLVNERTSIDNADGRLIIPGLTDAHLHFRNVSVVMNGVDLMEVPSKAEALHRVSQRVMQTPPGEWIYGFGWRKDLWEGYDFPTAADLDEVAPDHPVYLTSRSGHAAWVNSMALRLANITASTPDPEGGQFKRHANGSPTGILFEGPAMDPVYGLIPRPTPQALADWMLKAQQMALQVGLTGVHDYDGPECLAALQILRERGQLNLRVLKNINDQWIEHAYELGIRSGFGDEWVRIGGLKIFADGALGPQTALMIAAYDTDPSNFGIAVTDKEEMYEQVSKASRLGFSSTVHAIGDRAVHDILDVYRAVRREEAQYGTASSARRHRIEHVQIIHPDDVGRLAELDVVASMQPIHATSDYEMAERYWGERSAYSYALRKQLTAGAVLALGSDAPIETFDPRTGVYAAITRRRTDGSPGTDGWYPEERLTLEETLKGYTIGPAFAAYMDDRLGVLAPGYLADMIMLDRDWFTVPPEQILQTEVLGTMVGGQWRYRNF